jgi:hypothetical protein
VSNHAKVVAAVFALSAFAIALVAGIAAGNDAATVLLRALLALVACQVVGLFAGMIVERVIQEHETRYREENPVPSLHPTLEEPVDKSADKEGVGA